MRVPKVLVKIKLPLINPVAKALLRERKAKQIIPDKKKYNRKRDKHKDIT
tara:strand:- start:263 stop:412 length:150 start_codon:yes stop_codon:yes gene_type:complete